MPHPRRDERTNEAEAKAAGDVAPAYAAPTKIRGFTVTCLACGSNGVWVHVTPGGCAMHCLNCEEVQQL